MTLSEAPEDPVGAPIRDWRPPPHPRRRELEGRWAVLEPLEPAEHAEGLHAAFAEDREGRGWTYLSCGPFPNLDAFADWLDSDCTGGDPLFFAIRDQAGGRLGGMAAYLRVAPGAGAIGIGQIHLAPRLRRSREGSEALMLMIRHAFELGYRRVEWKCDALDARSRRAAERLGLTSEGLFRQAAIVKGRNRDTASYAAIDADWPALSGAHSAWLDPANFDANGRQRRPLSAFMP